MTRPSVSKHYTWTMRWTTTQWIGVAPANHPDTSPSCGSASVLRTCSVWSLSFDIAYGGDVGFDH
eukprot:3391201-Pyramimonas_sp.AAC.1